MSSEVCRAAAVALTGLDGTTVMVEAAVAQQLPGMAIIGLPDAALAEAKQRVRTASSQAGVPLPDRFVVINLAPASLPKQGSGFDLAIALAALAASRRLPTDRLADTAHVGELGLDGSLRRPDGLLSAVIAARALGFTRVMVPAIAATEARLVPNIEVVAAATLSGAVAWHRGEPQPEFTAAALNGSGAALTERAAPRNTQNIAGSTTPDMADVIGQADAVTAMTVAAAGRHHISLVGPPGSGKTLLANRLPTILPDLSAEESLRASSIASLSSAALSSLTVRPPFEHPHHTASSAAIIGSGDSRGIRPGAISRATHGVLFLDEAPEFGRSILDDLREPLESGTITISRARVHTVLPAQVQLVLAANPCPCGNAGTPDAALACTCTPQARVRYLGRLSGPLTDRIDLRLTVRRVSSVAAAASEPGETSSTLRERVILARARAAARLSETPWRLNSEVPGEWLRGDDMRLPRHATATIDRALQQGAITLRGYDRILRVAWTIADLAGIREPSREHVAEALTMRGTRA